MKLTGAYFLLTVSALFCWLAEAQQAAQTYTLDGRIFSDASGTTPLAAAGILFTVQILDSNQSCILYEENQTVDTSSSNGNFTIQIGSPNFGLAAAKRGSNDIGNTMVTVFSNSIASVGGKLVSNSSGCTYSPANGDSRYVRMVVTAPAAAAQVLSPNMELDSVPSALVAERAENLQGLLPANFLQVNTTSPANLSQANLENVFSVINYPKLTSLLAGGGNGTASAGSAAAPGLNFSGDTGTGFYDVSAGVIGVTSGGTQTMALSSTGITGAGALQIAAGGTNQALTLESSGNAAAKIGTGHGTGLSILDPGASTADYVTITGAVAGGSPVIATAGSDTNINLTLSPKGTGNTIFSSGNVGIGTNSPTSPFHLVNQSSALSGTNYGSTIDYQGAPGGGNSASFWGQRISSAYLANNGNSGTVGGLTAMASNPYQYGHTNSLMIGVQGNVTNPTTGTATSAIGGDFSVVNSSTGIIGSAKGINVGVTNPFGVLNTGYGVYIGSIAGTTTYGVFQSGSSNQNYFAGNVGIGTASPAATLDVYGQIDINGANGLSYPPTDSTAGGSVAIGVSALANESALASASYHNTAIGYQSMSSLAMTSAAANNTAIGYQTLANITSGGNNVGLGNAALYNLTSGFGNVGVGLAALFNNSTGSGNTGIGYSALFGANAAQNTAVGNNTMPGSVTGWYNSSLGASSLYSLAGGGANVAVGQSAGYDVTDGSQNIFLGFYPTTSVGITTGNNNILVGYDVRPPSQTANNQLNIGNLIYATGLGSGATISSGNVGVGTTSPGYTLDINGDINIRPTYALRFSGTSVCTSAGCTSSSDRSLKEHIQPLQDSLDKVLKLQGVDYDYKDKTKFTDKHQIGVIAQDVEKIYPEVVNTDPKSGLKSVAYDHLIAPLIEAFKTLFFRVLSIESHQTILDRQITMKADKVELDTKVNKFESDNVELKVKAAKLENEVRQLEDENAEMKVRLKKIETMLNSK
jgi:hypothetical protein